MLIKNTNLMQNNNKTTNELFPRHSSNNDKIINNKGTDLEKKNSQSNYIEASLTISKEAREQRAEEAILQAKRAVEQMKESLERAKESGDAEGKSIRVLIKCIKIAYRIIQGDIVPKQDMYFLMENNRELYTQAITMRMMKVDPKKWDSELEDEDLETELGMETKGEHSIKIEVENGVQTEGQVTEGS